MRRLVAFFILAAMMPVLAVPDWSKVRLSVIPGEGTEDFQLGGPLPESWPKQLGEPDEIFWYHGTGEGIRRVTWGELAKGQLNKGLTIMVSGQGDTTSINDIEIKRIRAGVSGENLFLGVPEASVSKRSELVQKDGKKSYLLPGLSIEAADGKLVGLRVHSPASTRWRFQKWRVRPGEAAGPTADRRTAARLHHRGAPRKVSRTFDVASGRLEPNSENQSGRAHRRSHSYPRERAALAHFQRRHFGG